jgi:acyl carrier protein
MSAGTSSASVSSVDVLGRLAGIVHVVTDVPEAEVQGERRFVDDLRIDSLSMVEILEGAAQHFGVRIDDEDAKDFVRVQDLVDYLAARLASAG